MSKSQQVFQSLEEVQRHGLLVIHRDVFDLNAFREVHPGGAGNIPPSGDGSEEFLAAGHGDRHREKLQSYKVGRLEVPEKVAAICVSSLTAKVAPLPPAMSKANTLRFAGAPHNPFPAIDDDIEDSSSSGCLC